MNSSHKAPKMAVAVLIFTTFIVAISAAPAPARAQAPAQNAAPKSAAAGQGATTKKAPSTVRAFDRALLRPALLKDKAPAQYKVKFVTTRGEFTIDVTRAWAPLGADRFYNLVKHHFYDNASVFRVVPSFVAQFGISAYPAVTTAWKGTDIQDDPVTQSNKKGYITFATAGQNTRLDRMGFAPFGVVEGDGMKVVEMFYDQYGDSAGPDQPKIEKEGKPYLDKGWPKLDTIKSAPLPPSARLPRLNPRRPPRGRSRRASTF